MVEVKLNKSNENPFYGMRNCLALFQNAGHTYISTSILDCCWEEVKGDKKKRELFFSLLFSVGDITARQHNIFKGVKRDSGGNANRDSFEIILDWMWNKHPEQFTKFLNAELFNEYTCFDALLKNRVKTKGNKVISVYSRLADEKYRKVLVEYLYKVINGNSTFNRYLVAKFLSLPRLSKRSGHKKMLPETKAIMENKVTLLIELSKLMGWEYEVDGVYCNFKGYRKWRKNYNVSLESVIFSTGAIHKLDKEQFLKWFDALPAQARYRVKNRILYSKIKATINSGRAFDEEVEIPKYPKLKEWYTIWEKYKEEKQKEQRVLEEKLRQGQASEEDKVKLEKVKKEAKVNVGATNFNEIYEQICCNNVDELKVESFMNKVNLPYNSLVIIDDSGSMKGKPFNFATFMAAICLCKNPDDDARNLLGFFNNHTHWHSYIDSRASKMANSILRTTVSKQRAEPFIDPELSFMDNYKRINAFCRAVFQGGGTNISSIPDGLDDICRRNPEVLDALKSYPVWTIISDGEWNNLISPEASINDFMRRCEKYFGFKPYIIAIDINGSSYYSSSERFNAERFSGIDNLMYIPSNPAQIEQFLTNFKDMDIFDIYAPLLSIYRSNRYDIVRENTL